MNETDILYAFGGISDSYILEAAETPVRRFNKRIVTILIAAAMLLVGSLGAAAYFNGDVQNGMRWRFRGGGEDDYSAIDGITSHDGRLTKNTFDGLEIGFGGAVCDNEELYAIFTVRKSDGTSFAAPEGCGWRVGFTELSYGGLTGLLGSYKETDNFHTVIDDDGTLLVSVPGNAVFEPNGKHDYKFSFTDLYLVPEEYLNGPHEELSEIQSVSVEGFSGTAACTVKSASLKADIPTYGFEYKGLPASADVTPIKIKIYAEGSGWDIKNIYTEQQLTIFYTDGSTEELECRQRFGGGNADQADWYMCYSGSKPIDASKIAYIVFDGVRIDIGG